MSYDDDVAFCVDMNWRKHLDKKAKEMQIYRHELPLAEVISAHDKAVDDVAKDQTLNRNLVKAMYFQGKTPNEKDYLQQP